MTNTNSNNIESLNAGGLDRVKVLRDYLEKKKQEAEALAKEKQNSDNNKPETPETPQPITLPNAEYSFITGQLANEIHTQLQKDYKDFPVILQTNIENDVLTGSNPYIVIAINKILRNSFPEFRTATQADLEALIQKQGFENTQLRNHYEDTGLVLKTKDNPNEYLAKHLAKQLKQINYDKFSNSNPLVIWLNQLELEKNPDSPSGLNFKLTPETLPFYAPVLSSKCNFSTTDANGIPIKNEKGNRTSWTADAGIHRLYLSRNLLAYSLDEYLEYSNGVGRVVIARCVAPSQAKI